PLRGAGGIPRLCALCGSTGSALVACRGCGDPYHDFCLAGALPAGAVLRRSQPVCPACRVCARCLGGPDDEDDDLLQCAECGQHMHVGCSGQQTAHPDGLQAAAAENGRWVCDACVSCAECGFAMDGADGPEWRLQAAWAHDFTMCGACAQQMERARVCPECIATYADGSNVSNSNMVCCDICAFWVHTDCDRALTPDVYDALITLEDAPYVCPHCIAATEDVPLVLDSPESASDDSYADWCAVPPGLPRCLRALPADGAETPLARLGDLCQLSLEAGATTPPPLLPLLPECAKGEPETEAANLLLSLTRSDVRFGRARFDVEALEARLCTRGLLARTGGWAPSDWRQCTLCGLRGDGVRGAAGVGRLIPLRVRPGGGEADPVARQWVHVECLAWAWGPRPVSVGGGDSPPGASLRAGGCGGLVRFEGALQAAGGSGAEDAPCCTLCGRAGASVHCCAPVACDAAAFHLPCLLLSGSPTAHLLPAQEQYCLAWRRALCAAHAPVFSAMMPADARPPAYADVRVEGCVTAPARAAPPAAAATVTLVGAGLLVLDWGSCSDLPPAQWAQLLLPPPGFRCVRLFEAAGALHAMGIAVEAAGWRGWISRGLPAELDACKYSDAAPSLDTLVERLFARLPPPPADSAPLAAVLARAAAARPLLFLGLARCDLPALLAAHGAGTA
ncbi:hypothetical protein IWQ57_001938, partial [Coemansia nantahalensis]